MENEITPEQSAPVETKNEVKRLSPQKIRDNISAADKWLRSGLYAGDGVRWKQWEKNQKYLMCVWPDKKDGDVTYNSIFANFNTVRPTLFFKNPKLTATPTKPRFKRDVEGNQVLENGKPVLIDNYGAARLFGIKVNYELRELGFKKTLKKVLGDVLCPYGIGWIKVGYSLMTVGGHNNDGKKVQYWIKRVDPRNLVYDWMATDAESSRFFAERLILTRSDAKKYGFNIPDTYTCVLPEFLKKRSKKGENAKEDDDLIVLWEYHDREENVLYWSYEFGPDGVGPNGYPKDPVSEPYPFEGSSYVPCVFNDNNDDICGLSDVEPIEDQALAINRIRTKQTKHIDNFGTRTVYEDTAILDSDIENIKTNDHGSFLKLQAGGFNKYRIDPTPPLGADNYEMDALHKDDMRTVSGITDYQQGGAQARASETATAASIIQNAANVRIEERKDTLADFIIEVVRRLAALIQYFGEEEEFLNVGDEDFTEDFIDVLKKEHGYNPKIPFLHMTKEAIQGEYNWSFNIEDMISRPKEIQLQQWNGLLQTFLSNPAFAQKFMADYDTGKIIKKTSELAGVDLDEVKKGGPVQISVEKENMMFLRGMEVPDPHEKDEDDEHIMGHERAAREIEQKLHAGQAEIEQLTGQTQMFMQQAEQAKQTGLEIDPAQIQEAQQQTEMRVQEIQDQLAPLEMILRRIRLHDQQHEAKNKAKEMELMGQMPPQVAPDPAAMQQGA